VYYLCGESKVIDLECSHFGKWEKCDFSRKSGKLSNFTLNIDFPDILDRMDQKILTLFLNTFFMVIKNFSFQIAKILVLMDSAVIL
jgi:hypothetical protein